jgi:hypothetical protein
MIAHRADRLPVQADLGRHDAQRGR